MTAEGPEAREELRGVLVALRRRVDDHFAAAVARTPSAFACREGCDRCCHQRFGVFEVEAAVLREALAELEVRDPELRARVRRQADDPAHGRRCALLVDGRCAVYEARPTICRSHGLPILAEEPAEVGAQGSRGRVDHCPLNFTDGSTPPAASVLRLAAVNQPLAVLATLWQRAEGAGAGVGTSAESGGRVDLAALARGGLDGE
ncbi:MAG: YkgJ family cysteine cluster protein [Nannocystaceae bacterium]